MNKKQYDENEFYRILSSYDKDTLIDLLDSYMTLEEKKDFIKSFIEEDE